MTKKILIDGGNSHESRIVLLENENLSIFTTENLKEKTIKGNVYLAKVTRIEPALQAVFIEYSENRNGFLPFSEISTKYYNIPKSDLLKFEEEKEKIEKEKISSDDFSELDFSYPLKDEDFEDEDEDDEIIKEIKNEEKFYKKYTVQEVIRHGQILLVQVIRDERGNKGAAFTTYVSIPGQYLVLRPNSFNQVKISKKIGKNQKKKLKKIITEIIEDFKNNGINGKEKNSKIDVQNFVEKCSIIVRTGGMNRTKKEIKKDYESLLRTWIEISEKILQSKSRTLVYEEGSLIKKFLRDHYNQQIEEIITEKKEDYDEVKNFVVKIAKTHVKKIKLHKDSEIPLFDFYEINQKLLSLISNKVNLPSGGHLMFGVTEALTAIDVNSGKSINERNISNTALKTNLEAAEEIARQLRLRDIGGLVVIDFIDMRSKKNNQMVEKKMFASVFEDKAKINIGEISQFGLMELSRQRLRQSFFEMHSVLCPHCSGSGFVCTENYFYFIIINVLKKIISEEKKDNNSEVKIILSNSFSENFLNNNKKNILSLEEFFKVQIFVVGSKNISESSFIIKINSKELEFINGIEINKFDNLNLKIGKKRTYKKNEKINQSNDLKNKNLIEKTLVENNENNGKFDNENKILNKKNKKIILKKIEKNEIDSYENDGFSNGGDYNESDYEKNEEQYENVFEGNVEKKIGNRNDSIKNVNKKRKKNISKDENENNENRNLEQNQKIKTQKKISEKINEKEKEKIDENKKIKEKKTNLQYRRNIGFLKRKYPKKNNEKKEK